MKTARDRSRREPTHYINVDLDIWSREPLEGLVGAMGAGALVLYVGGRGRQHEAHVELASSGRGMSADRTIVGLTRLVQRLPPRYRKVWDSARSREFNVGIAAGLEPHGFELHLNRATLEALLAVRGTLAVTVYAPDPGDAATSKRRRRAP